MFLCNIFAFTSPIKSLFQAQALSPRILPGNLETYMILKEYKKLKI